jgi:hypothetical protein
MRCYQPGTGAMLERAFQALGRPLPRDVVHCESYAVALALISQTDRLGLLIPQMVTEPYAERHLQPLHPAERIPGPLVGMYTPLGHPAYTGRRGDGAGRYGRGAAPRAGDRLALGLAEQLRRLALDARPAR